jgi:hypothetical protein
VAKKKDSDYPIGYKKPPRDKQFQPGQSGNPNGRPKKVPTFMDAIQKELRSLVTLHEGGKRRKISKLHAIAKQQTNKAVNGDNRATALVVSVAEPPRFDPMDSLTPLLHEMRAIHAKHEASGRDETPKKEGPQSKTVGTTDESKKAIDD